jgi:metallo-beta-lactamase family protein
LKRIIISVVLIVIIVIILLVRFGERGVEYPLVEFCGGAREVGGSCLLFETGRARWVIDCGAMSDAGLDILPSRPAELSFAILTHAHSDHCGYLPQLCERGFKGKIYCTPPTAKIVPIMLKMARSFSRDKVSGEAFNRTLSLLSPVDFDKIIEEDGLTFRFRRAEHLLGAGLVEQFIIKDDGDTVRVVVSGDLGGGNSILLPPLDGVSKADFVIMESTYGSVSRDYQTNSPVERKREFAECVGEALRRGGDVLIPAFALGRTQEVLAAIDFFMGKEVIPSGTPVFTDSPTAQKITGIYREFRDQLSRRATDFYGERILYSPGLREVRSRTSLKVHGRKHRPSIFISTSGNLMYAISPGHLIRMYDDEKNLLCLVGWQSPGSPGSQLALGEEPVLIKYRQGRELKEGWISPCLQVESFHSFSGHADCNVLLGWLKSMEGVKKVFLVHGEEEQAMELADRIEKHLGMEVEVPQRGERRKLDKVGCGWSFNR